LARAVCTVTLPPSAAQADLEYYVEAVTAEDQLLRFPASAPALSQTVVVMPAQ
jgi:hypothetical protein